MSFFSGPVAVNVSILCFTVALLIFKDSVDHHLYSLFSHKFMLTQSFWYFIFISLKSSSMIPPRLNYYGLWVNSRCCGISLLFYCFEKRGCINFGWSCT